MEEQKIIRYLQNNSTKFKNTLIGMVDDHISSDLNICLLNPMRVLFPLRIERDHCLSIINDTLNDSNCLSYDELNGLHYLLKGEIEIDWEREEECDVEYRELFFDKLIQKKISEIEKEEFYQVHSNFNAHEVIEVDKAGLNKLKASRRGTIINVDQWLIYFDHLIKYFYSYFDSEITKKDGINIVCKKNINEKKIITIEYDKKELKSSLTIGKLKFPELKLYLISDTRKILICKIENPFAKGVMNLSSFLAINSIVRETEGSYRAINETIIEEIGNGLYRLSQKKEFGELLKKYAFLNCKLNSIFSRYYIDFIILIIQEI